MHRVTERWTDERLDDMNDRIALGFERVDRDIRDLRADVNLRFNALDARLDALHRLLVRAARATIAVLVTTGAGLVATQL